DVPLPLEEVEEPQVWVNGEIFQQQEAQAEPAANENAQQNGDAHPDQENHPRIQLDP
ncbi:unnamed protein product, partial [Allacma fusca]